jgi:putative methyltransferase (TIGR04325 family)
MGLRGAIKHLLRVDRTIRFEGDYPTWDAAQRHAGSYDSATIVEKMFGAELAVKNGTAADARDGVRFGEIQFSLPVMAGLGRIAKPRPRVVDFGGAFGGSYRQFKAFYGKPVSWSVVEQPSMVGVGREHFRNAELDFYPSLEAALATGPADVILLSSVLQYLPEPYAFIRQVESASIDHVIVDRTPCSALPRDVLSVQHVPPEIYAASYPCWIFSRARLLAACAGRFELIASFSDGSGTWRGEAAAFELAGFLLDRRPG